MRGQAVLFMANLLFAHLPNCNRRHDERISAAHTATRRQPQRAVKAYVDGRKGSSSAQAPMRGMLKRALTTASQHLCQPHREGLYQRDATRRRITKTHHYPDVSDKPAVWWWAQVRADSLPRAPRRARTGPFVLERGNDVHEQDRPWPLNHPHAEGGQREQSTVSVKVGG
jgi:CHAD domain-containing protein